MSTVVKIFNFFIKSVIASIKSASEYKISFITNTIFMIINNSVFLVSWYVIFQNAGSDDAVNFKKVLSLWALSTISYGINYFFFGGVSNINRFLIDGELDMYLTKPKNPLIAVLTSKCRFSACGDLIFGIIIAVYVSNSLVDFVQILVFGIYGTVFLLSIEIILRSLSVWLGDTETLTSRLVTNMFISITTYPLDIFGTFVKIITFTVIPAAYAVHLPLEIIDNFSFSKLLIVTFAGIFFVSLAIFTFNKAIKSYESGNNISMKI